MVKYTQTQQKARSDFHCIQNKSEKKTPQNPFQSKVLHTAGVWSTGGKKGRRKSVDLHHQRLRNHTALFGNYLQTAFKYQIKEKAASLKIETNQTS